MKYDDHETLVEELLSRAKKIRDDKRAAYTGGNEDVLWNFKRDGAMQGIDPMQNWLSHFLKQVAAVVSFVKNPDVIPSEPLINRMADIINYCPLGLGLALDQQRRGTLPAAAKSGIVIHKDSDYE